ncbi:MAG: aspartate aminotransferase, partial [Myxococcota bacterium]
PIDVARFLPADHDAAMRSAVTNVMANLKGSMILGISSEVRALKTQGREVCNLTIGDFSSEQFPMPRQISDGVLKAYKDGQTGYPPADGVPELKAAIAALYKRRLNVDYDPSSVCVGSGARPPMYATWRLITRPGDRTISFLPAWNNSYYAHICETKHEFIPTLAENDFFPTVEAFAEALKGTRLVILNSPLNPTGTSVSREVLTGYAQAIVDENRSRGTNRPVMMMFDQVYWLLTAEGVSHHSPVALVPEVAPYIVHTDAISKCFAATGLRVGWGVMPTYMQGRMKALIGHAGAWAPRPEQLATAWLLQRPDEMDAYIVGMRGRISDRLDLLYRGIQDMKARGMPVDAIAPQGAIYLSLHLDLIGRGFDTNEDIRSYLLNKAGVALVPFQAFDMPENSGWFRASIGAVSPEDLSGALERMESAIKARL